MHSIQSNFLKIFMATDFGFPSPNEATALDTILKVTFAVIGALAVIFIIIGGFQYVLSGGDSNNTNRAKETILYAVVGLIISLLAFTIVDFVVGQTR